MKKKLKKERRISQSTSELSGKIDLRPIDFNRVMKELSRMEEWKMECREPTDEERAFVHHAHESLRFNLEHGVIQAVGSNRLS